MSGDRALELEGAAAYPRRNGQPVFSAPWQSRVFGMAMTLHEQGDLDWEAFRERLIAEIVADDTSDDADEDGSRYYSRWLIALTGTVAATDLVSATELGLREAEYADGTRRELP